MKKIAVFFIIFSITFTIGNIFAQEESEIEFVETELAETEPVETEPVDTEYLTENDILAVETVLEEDTPPSYEESQTVAIEEEPSEEVAQAEDDTLLEEETTVEVAEVKEGNEIARLNTSQVIYHLLILDRIYSPLYSDLSGMENLTVLYKFLHGKDGYLIAVYKSSKEGPVFPQMPNGSRVLVDFVTVWPEVLKEYINSAAFRRFVTSRGIISDLQNLYF